MGLDTLISLSIIMPSQVIARIYEFVSEPSLICAVSTKARTRMHSLRKFGCFKPSSNRMNIGWIIEDLNSTFAIPIFVINPIFVKSKFPVIPIF